MIALPRSLYDDLKKLADRNNRPVSWEARIHIVAALVAAGIRKATDDGNSP